MAKVIINSYIKAGEVRARQPRLLEVLLNILDLDKDRAGRARG